MNRIVSKKYSQHAFTLVELLIAISILGIIVTLVSGMFIDSFKQSRKFALQNSVYEDAHFIMNQLEKEIASSRIDYDEYYNQRVVIPTHPANSSTLSTYGQNFGFYYSAFFHPGEDNLLGYRCNNGDRNKPERYLKNGVATICTPERGSLDQNTGENPYTGKTAQPSSPVSENAFCIVGLACPASPGLTKQVSELYLISSDGKQKTILARERIGGTVATPVWALSRVRMNGDDFDADGVIDRFVCADGYSCGASDACASSEGLQAGVLVPRKGDDLNPVDDQFQNACDNAANGFSHDFVPLSPLRADVMELSFQILPFEDPDYAFSEPSSQRQPQVTISMTIQPNPDIAQDKKAFTAFTLVRTVTAARGEMIKAPIKVQ